MTPALLSRGREKRLGESSEAPLFQGSVGELCDRAWSDEAGATRRLRRGNFCCMIGGGYKRAGSASVWSDRS